LDTILNKSNLNTLLITRNSWTGFSLQRIHGHIFHFKETLDNFSLQIYPRHIYNYNGSREAFIFTRKFWTPPITWELDTIPIQRKLGHFLISRQYFRHSYSYKETRTHFLLQENPGLIYYYKET
jgi:hypothetical protein